MSKLESPAEKKTEHEITIEVEKVVLPQVVSIKKASELMGLPAYYLRRLCKEVPGLAFQSGVKWYINLGKLAEYYRFGSPQYRYAARRTGWPDMGGPGFQTMYGPCLQIAFGL